MFPIKRMLALALMTGSVLACAQTASVTVMLANGQTVTIPVTVSLGVPVLAGTPTAGGGTGTGSSGSTTPPPTTNTCSLLSLGKDAATNGYLSKSIPEFNMDISSLPVDAAKTNHYLSQYCDGGCDHMHFDNTVPYSVVNNPSMVAVKFSDSADSDNVKYPLSSSTPTEGGIIGTTGANGKIISSSGDHHALVIDTTTCTDYEIYQATYKNGAWTGYAGVAWDMTKTVRRPVGETSADLAGFPIYPLLIKYDEANSGVINHAFRVTCGETNSQFLAPATHSSGGGGSCYPGMVLRLKSNFDVTKYPPRIHAIMNALKHYGMYVADSGGNLYVTADDDPRWNVDETNMIGDLNESLFEVVNTGAQLQKPPL